MISLTRTHQTEIDVCIEQIREWLYFPDPMPIYAVMGALAGNMMVGDPCWLMVVGPPSDGKSELINSMLGVRGVVPLHKVNGDASFLSATSKKDTAKDATGGVLRLVGRHGCVVMDDFTSVLSLQKERQAEVLDVFRQTYIGTWSRDVGSDGGRKLSWTGKLGMLAGCTGVIDANAQVSGSLGERWMYYRTSTYKTEDQERTRQYEKTRRALLNAERSVEKAGWREELREWVAAYIHMMGLEFGGKRKVGEDGWEGGMQAEPLQSYEVSRIIAVGELASWCRSAVVRDAYKRDIVGAKETERGTRLSTALRQLYVGMRAVGVKEPDRWRVIRKVGMDCLPTMRRVVVEEALAGAVRVGGKEGLARMVGTSDTAMTRTVEDLEVHGVVSVTLIKGQRWVELTSRARGELEKGWGGIVG